MVSRLRQRLSLVCATVLIAACSRSAAKSKADSQALQSARLPCIAAESAIDSATASQDRTLSKLAEAYRLAEQASIRDDAYAAVRATVGVVHDAFLEGDWSGFAQAYADLREACEPIRNFEVPTVGSVDPRAFVE